MKIVIRKRIDAPGKSGVHVAVTSSPPPNPAPKKIARAVPAPSRSVSLGYGVAVDIKTRPHDPHFKCHVCKRDLNRVCGDDFAVCYTPQGTRYWLCRPWTPQACETKWNEYWYRKRQKGEV